MQTIQVTDEEKTLFLKWLNHRVRSLSVQLETAQSLIEKLSPNETEASGDKPPPLYLKRGLSWAEKVVCVLKQIPAPTTSTQIIDWLIANDKELKGKTRDYITSGVTSKLVVLVSKERVKKEIINDKNYYTLIKE